MKLVLMLTLGLLFSSHLYASVEFISPDVYVVSPDGNVLEDIFHKFPPSWNEVYSIKKS